MAYQAAPLKQKLREVALETILDAAERCMCASGYEQATMQQIAADAGCAIGTLYLYYKSKEDLFRALVDRHALVMFALARKAVEAAEDPVEKVYAGIRAIMAYEGQHRPSLRLFYAVMPMRHRHINRALGGSAGEANREYLALELATLKEAQQRGQIRTDIPAERLQQFMGDVCISAAEEFVSTDDSSLEEYTRLLFGLIGSGMGVRQQEKQA